MTANPQHKTRRCPTCGRDDFESDQAYAGHRSRHSTKAYVLTPDHGRRGAQALNNLPIPAGGCLICGRKRFSSRAAYNSHMGLHGLAKALGFGSNRIALRRAAQALSEMGFWTTDPMRDINMASQRGLRHLIDLGKVF